MSPKARASRAQAQALAAKRPWFTQLHGVFLGAYLALGLIQGYANVARFDPVEQASNDSSVYLAMTQGQPLQDTLQVYRWRALTPLMVRWMPGPPGFLTRHYQVDPLKVIRFKYAVWNTLGDLCAAFGLLLFMQAMGFSLLQAGFGGLLYASSAIVQLEGASMVVDPWANAAIIAALCFSLKRRNIALALAFSLGIFVKETLLIVPAYLFLMRKPGWFKQCLWLLPGFFTYAWFRRVLYPDGPGRTFSLAWLPSSIGEYLHLGSWVYLGFEFTLYFMVLAPLAWLGWRDSHPYPGLRRMAWVLPALFVTPIVLGTELARPWFDGFPVFIPLAVLGLWRLAGYADAQSRPFGTNIQTIRR